MNARTGQPIVLLDPLNIGIVNNVIPRSALSKEALAFLEYRAAAEHPEWRVQLSVHTGQRGFETGQLQRPRRSQLSAPRPPSPAATSSTTPTKPASRSGATTSATISAAPQNIATSYTHTFTPDAHQRLRASAGTKFSEFEVFGTTNDPAYRRGRQDGTSAASPACPQEYGPPSISISGPDGGFNTYDLQRQIGPRDRSNSILQFADTLSWQRGKHFLRFGVDIARRGVTFEQARDPRGSFTFDGTYTGSALADFLLGYVQSGRLNPAHTSTDLHNYWQAYFINDDWKVTPDSPSTSAFDTTSSAATRNPTTSSSTSSRTVSPSRAS